MDYDVLEDKIHVYKNLIEDPEGLVKILKDSENDPEKSYFFRDWQDWFIFGTYIVFNGKDMPTVSEGHEPERYLQEKRYLDNIDDCFYSTTNHFLDYYNEKKQNDWIKMGPSFAKYFHDNKKFEEFRKYAMIFHTDYQNEPDHNGKDFGLTCTMYLNDNYSGGKVIFKIGDKKITYSPKAGDILVFPSGHPDFMSEKFRYEHAVTKVTKNDKYFIRCFYKI